MSESLTSLVQQTKNILAVIVENGGELTPELENSLTLVDVKLPAKVDSYAVVLERLDLEQEYWENKADQFARVAKACKTIREKLKDNLKYAMQELETDEIKGIDHRFKLSNSKPRLIIDELTLDQAYTIQVTSTQVDKKRIEEDLKLGVPVIGARLEETKSIRTYVNKGAK